MKKFELSINPNFINISGSANIVNLDAKLDGNPVPMQVGGVLYPVALDVSKQDVFVAKKVFEPTLRAQKLHVFDHLGEKKFETNGSIYNNDWAGTDNEGNLLPDGQYILKLESNDSYLSVPRLVRLYGNTDSPLVISSSANSAVVFNYKNASRFFSVLKNGKWKYQIQFKDQDGNIVNERNELGNVTDLDGVIGERTFHLSPGFLPDGLYNLTLGLQWMDENDQPTTISWFQELDQKIEIVD